MRACACDGHNGTMGLVNHFGVGFIVVMRECSSFVQIANIAAGIVERIQDQRRRGNVADIVNGICVVIVGLGTVVSGKRDGGIYKLLKRGGRQGVIYCCSIMLTQKLFILQDKMIFDSWKQNVLVGKKKSFIRHDFGNIVSGCDLDRCHE